MKKLFQINPDVLGDGRVLFEWSAKGNFLAACGTQRQINIYDRNGRLFDELHLPAPEIPTGDSRAPAAAALQWDPAGDQLAVVPNGNTFVFIWSASTKEMQKIDTDFKTPQELSTLCWSRNGINLAIGTAKGNLIMYNSRERKKTPSLGKHTKKIVCSVWNSKQHLAMAGLDRLVTITDGGTGESLRQFALKGDPVEMCVAVRKDSGQKGEDNTYSINVSRKTICIMECSDNEDKPVDLEFLPAYGNIHKHFWFLEGLILVAFKSGQLVVVSSHTKELAEEMYSSKVLDVLSDVAFAPTLGRMAVAGANCVRILDATSTNFAEIKTDSIDLEPNQSIDKVGWTRDGQVLTVATVSGQLISYLSALPSVLDSYDSKVMHLTSLLEMSVVDVTKRGLVNKIDLQSEVAVCGLGPTHAAVGMNNTVWFHQLAGGKRDSRQGKRREYMGSVQKIKLSATHVAVLLDGKVVVHPLEVEAGQRQSDYDVVLPPRGKMQTVQCLAITPAFVITGSKQGLLSYYLLEELTPEKDASSVNEYRHEEGGITHLFPQPGGSRMIFEDERGNVNLFNPVNDQVLVVPDFNGRAEHVMWDVAEPNVFVVADTNTLYTYLYQPVSLAGPQILLVGKQSIMATHMPLVLASGTVGCRLKGGTIDPVVLDTHKALLSNDAIARSAPPQRKFQQCLKLGRLKAAWEMAVTLRTAEAWGQLGQAGLESLDVEVAVAAYRMLGDASMVLSLERIKKFEDKNLLAAHIMVLLDRDHATAQELFLRSSVPSAALEMRKDLKHWSEALKLAEQLDPDAIAGISKEHAAALEMTGEYSNAKSHYQQALDSLSVSGGQYAAGMPLAREVEFACKAGIARCTLQLGDLRGGRSQALTLNNQTLFKECAMILEGLSQFSEAAEMYERAGQLERAASIYIQAKNFTAAAPLMAKISSAKLQLQYAKAKEAEGRFAEAATAYEAAGDLDAVVRLALEKLGAPQRAYAIVRKTRSQEAAASLATHCLQAQDFAGAVEFLLLAHKMDQAFDIAQGHNEMDTFARIVAASAQPSDYSRIAQYYESRGEFIKAGDMWFSGENYPRAVQLYLRQHSDAALDKAITVVEKTKAHNLGVLVLDYVAEEKEGSAKDEYRFKLNIAMGQYMDAARDAMELARFEQEEGNYRVAHDQLFNTVRQLEVLNTKPPTELLRALMLLHSYILVKSLININDHTGAARMLVRVARSISKFPKHIVPILTSTIIECNRAGLKKTAFEYAAMLMRPEYRDQVAAKYKKKIELMVRKPEKDPEELEEALVPCVYCDLPGPETELQCFSCQNIIPFDISTGKRMVTADWAECPTCRFPCGAAQFIRILAAERRCPMCNDEVNLEAVRKVMDPLGALRRKQEAFSSGGAAPVATLLAHNSSSPGNRSMKSTTSISGSGGGAPLVPAVGLFAANGGMSMARR